MTAQLGHRAADRGRPRPTRRFRGRPFRRWVSTFAPGYSVAVLTVAGLQGSPRRVASAGDNAAMESFWALLQKMVLNRQRWRTRDELPNAIVFGSECTYNRRLKQRALGQLALPSRNCASPHPRPPSRHGSHNRGQLRPPRSPSLAAARLPLPDWAVMPVV
jgi:transposase InsO family protein